MLTAAGHKLAIAVIAMSLLVSPIWFLMARLFHSILQSQASRIMGLDLKNFRLWRTAHATGFQSRRVLVNDHFGLVEGGAKIALHRVADCMRARPAASPGSSSIWTWMKV